MTHQELVQHINEFHNTANLFEAIGGNIPVPGINIGGQNNEGAYSARFHNYLLALGINNDFNNPLNGVNGPQPDIAFLNENNEPNSIIEFGHYMVVQIAANEGPLGSNCIVAKFEADLVNGYPNHVIFNAIPQVNKHFVYLLRDMIVVPPEPYIPNRGNHVPLDRLMRIANVTVQTQQYCNDNLFTYARIDTPIANINGLQYRFIVYVMCMA